MSNKNLKTLYKSDGYAWYFKNAELLKNKKFTEIDFTNIAEELESIGRSEEKELQRYLILILLHLLKWKYQPKKQSVSWESTIAIQRIHYHDHLKKNPSLKGHLKEIVPKSYELARLEARKETGLPLNTFPEKMPFTLEDALTENWFPKNNK